MGRIVCNEIDYSGSPLVTDSTPNASSVNPVTSAGVYKAIYGDKTNILVGTDIPSSVNNLVMNSGTGGTEFTTYDFYHMSQSYKDLSLEIGDSVTISFDWVVTNAPANATFKVGTNSSPYEFFTKIITLASGNNAGHYTSTFAVTSDLIASTGNLLRLRFDGANGMNMTLSNAKLSISSIESKWSASPADIGFFVSTPTPDYIANNLPILKRNITNAYYNGSLKSEIAAANFKNVRPGDYIIGQTTGTTYYVVDLDYWWHRGDKGNVTENPGGYTHHLCIMPYRLLTTGTMTPLWQGWGSVAKDWHVSTNDKGRCPWVADTNVDPQEYESVGKNDTTGGYLNSYIKTYALDRIYNDWLIADFGVDNVLKFRNRLGNTTNTSKTSSGQPNWNGCTSDWTWVDSYCDLPSEPNLFGNMIFSSSAMDVGCQYDQLALFKQASLFTFYDRMDVWTKAVSSSTYAAYLTSYGVALSNIASFAYWVCPLALIK